jgi:hypothetical protein
MGSYASDAAAHALGIAPATLRRWSTEFVGWLSPGANAAERSYSEEDMRVLSRAAELIRQRRGYAYTRERLTAEFSPVERERVVGEALEEELAGRDLPGHEDGSGQAAGAVEAEVIEPEAPVPPDIAALLERMAELYRELLRNKEQEIAALRQALDTAELSATNERRELDTLNRLSAILERENQRLAAELEDARRRLGEAPIDRSSWRARLARWLGRSGEPQSAPQP